MPILALIIVFSTYFSFFSHFALVYFYITDTFDFTHRKIKKIKN